MRRLSRKSIFHMLEPFQAQRKIDRFANLFLLSLIVLNVIAIILETVNSIGQPYERYFLYFEIFSATIFSFEYILRIWVVPEYKKGNSLKERLKYIFSPMAVVDLLAILPTLIPMFLGGDLRALKALRIFRIVRVFKLGRYSKSLILIGNVLKQKTPELLTTAAVGAFLLTFAASGIYFFENEAQPEAFSSIPAAMWWAVATLTTVGYGDIYPVTMMGKVFGSLIAFLGIGLIAIPTGILGAGLVEAIESNHKSAKKKKYCPHCGEELDETHHQSAA